MASKEGGKGQRGNIAVGKLGRGLAADLRPDILGEGGEAKSIWETVTCV